MIVFLIIAAVFSYLAIGSIVYALISHGEYDEDAICPSIVWPLFLLLLIAGAVILFPSWMGDKLRNWYKERKEDHHEN